MPWKTLLLATLASVIAGTMRADDAVEEKDKLLGGMSIVGNDEAPKSLVIVPWKSSELSDAPAISNLLDDGRAPLDPEVFARELDYYAIRTAEPADSGPAPK
jgi:hypothetical protein